jgi:two-component system chemotaxis sensor kinase CheA
MADDPYQYFRIEAREILARLGAGILELESGEPAPDLVARLLRDAHTLKGAARVVRQPAIADAAHAVEDALAPHREPGQPLPRELIGRLLNLVDRMSSGTAALDNQQAASENTPVDSRHSEVIPATRAETDELDELLEAITELASQLAATRHTARTVERLRHTANLLTQQLPAGQSSHHRPAVDGATNSGLARSISVELRTALVALDRQLAGSLDRADRELRHVRLVSERLRLARAGTIFTPLRRAARDVADAMGKETAFETRGGDVRLDAQVLAIVHTALLHIVRNAVAHGIETPLSREAAGKSRRGKVVVEVERRGRRISFTCRDDGLGFNLDAVRREAQAKGLLPAGTDPTEPAELVAVLLRGGISTSETVTGVSGRGIGLDVVRDVARQLGGVVDIRTEPGLGATVELVVPLSMVALDGLVVESDGLSVTIPLDCVRRSMRVLPQQLVCTADGDRILVGEKLIPFIPLARALATEPASARSAQPWSTLVVEGRDGTAAVGVDRLVGTASIVLRPLPDLVPATAVVAGAAIDPDGNPHLVLDPDGLVGEAHNAGPVRTRPAAPRLPILVIDDSLTTRMLERSILESAGYEVDLVTCGEEALVAAQDKRYGLFLVDVEMPGIDGFTFIERIRDNAALRGTPSILVTSRSSVEDRRRADEVGADAYLVKSEFDQDVLIAHIRRLMDRA